MSVWWWLTNPLNPERLRESVRNEIVCRYCGRNCKTTVVELGHPLGPRCGPIEQNRCVELTVQADADDD